LYRINELHKQEILEKENQVKELQADIASQKKWWSTKLLNHDKELEEVTRRYEEEIRLLQGSNDELKEKIEKLNNRVNELEGNR
jgi:predicted RNase H-like nuclease (RuvC/YqgF family)